MSTVTRSLILFAFVGTTFLSGLVVAQQPSPPLTLSFSGGEYLHRWSKDGQHEFTPKGEEDLSKWTSMLTVNVFDAAGTGDDLAEIANRILGNYQQAGNANSIGRS